MPALFVLVQSAPLLPEPVTPEPEIGIGKIESLSSELEPEPAVTIDELWSWAQLCEILCRALAWSTTKLEINAVANTTAITPKTNCLFM